MCLPRRHRFPQHSHSLGTSRSFVDRCRWCSHSQSGRDNGHHTRRSDCFGYCIDSRPTSSISSHWSCDLLQPICRRGHQEHVQIRCTRHVQDRLYRSHPNQNHDDRTYFRTIPRVRTDGAADQQRTGLFDCSRRHGSGLWTCLPHCVLYHNRFWCISLYCGCSYG